jgi:O-antigen ligase
VGLTLAFLIFTVGIVGLFILERDRREPRNPALWLPVFWWLMIGSRPVSSWLALVGIGSGASDDLDAQLEGSPIEAVVLSALLLAGLLVLIRRRQRVSALLISAWPLLLYLVYSLSSCLWSPFPEVAFKRWVRQLVAVVIVLIVASDRSPMLAFRRVLFRTGAVLLPYSVMMIRYSPLGRGYDPDGNPMNTGVTTNKNALGLMTFVVMIGIVWGFLQTLRDRQNPRRRQQLIAEGTLIIFGIAVLYMAHSATSLGCFAMGSLLIFLAGQPVFRRSPGRLHVLVVGMAAVVGLSMAFGLDSLILGAMGRDSTLTGRTEIWQAVIPLCPNPLIGTGFDSFWNTYGGHLEGLKGYIAGVTTAHNGYIETYLNLGWLGVFSVSLIILGAYGRAARSFRINPEDGRLMLALVATAAVYSVTEAGFRSLTPSWFILVLAATATAASRRDQSAVSASEPVTAADGMLIHSLDSNQAVLSTFSQRELVRNSKRDSSYRNTF